MRKPTFLLLSLLIVPFIVSAQSSDKLEQAYGPEELAQMKSDQPEHLEYLRFKSIHCYSVQDLSGKKDISEWDDISSLNALARKPGLEVVNAERFNKDTFNPLLFETPAKTVYYKVGDTGVLLKVFGEEQCKALYNK